MGWLCRRLPRLFAVLLIVTFASYSLVRLLPGDPAVALLGPQAPPDQIAAFRREMRLDQSAFTSYFSWLGDLVGGDFGTSFKNGIDVTRLLWQRIPVSVELMILAEFLALVVAIPVGVGTGYLAGRLPDRLWTFLSYIAIAAPTYLVAVVLIYIFPVQLGWFQVSGYTKLSDGLGANLSSLALPAVSLAFIQTAIFTSVLRSDIIDTLREDYMDSARARGLGTTRLLFKYALRPSSLSLLTVIGLSVGSLLSGAVIVESMFGIPGLGSLLYEAVQSKDLPVMQAVMVLLVVAYVVVNLLVDWLYRVVDPRVEVAE